MVDSMCGSGTILTEAALMAHNVAPGLLRSHWSLTEWHDFDAHAWQNTLEEARHATRRDWDGIIAGCDTHGVCCCSVKLLHILRGSFL
jgi:putative N6-adenine-specific DNA methylase